MLESGVGRRVVLPSVLSFRQANSMSALQKAFQKHSRDREEQRVLTVCIRTITN